MAWYLQRQLVQRPLARVSQAEGINAQRDGKRSFLVITHYQRLLDYLTPDRVHVLAGGRIVESGGQELAERLEAEGYAFLEEESAA